MSLVKTFAENLAAARRAYGLTQAELGTLINRQGTTIGNWERGVYSPGLDTVEKLAEALETTAEALLSSPADSKDFDRIRERIADAIVLMEAGRTEGARTLLESARTDLNGTT